jgi:hypothetical protein
LFFDDVQRQAMLGLVGFFMIIPFPIIGLLSIIFTKANQRLGDLAANTVVIQQAKTISLDETILQQRSDEYKVVYPQALKLRDRDIYIIKNIVQKSETQLDHKKIVRLADKAETILGVKRSELPLHFLRTLIKDYNHLAQEKDLETKKDRLK